MKKNFLFSACFVLSATLNAQSVGVGTTTPTSTLEVNGSLSIKIITTTSDIALDSSHALVLCNNPTNITVSLPSAIGIAGRIYHLKKINTGSVNIITTTGQTIDGAVTAALNIRNASVQLVSNGINWFMINSIAPHYIGEALAGGVVFYIDGTGQHGLVSATVNQHTNASWGCIGTSIPGAQGIAVGTGLGNTSAIVAGCVTTGIAAQICNDLVLNGYSDWYLPSKNELNLMYVNLKLNGLGNFGVGNLYWSSSEINPNQAWRQDFAHGSAIVSNKSSLETTVRAIRTF